MKTSTIGEKLKLLRAERDFSQKEFAEYLNIPQPTLSTYENNRVVPTLDAIVSIAKKCTVSLDWLCGVSNRHALSTLGDVSDFYYQLLETSEIGFSTVTETTDDTWHIVNISVHEADGFKYNIPFTQMLMRVIKTFEEYTTKGMSKDYYDLAKERDCAYYDKIPLSKRTDLPK